MDKGRSIHLKLKRLFQLTWGSQRKFAEVSGINRGTINEFFSKQSNLTVKNFIKVLSALGIDLELVIEREIKNVIGDKKPQQHDLNEDIALLLSGLKKSHRKELLIRAINLNKLQKNTSIYEVIERVERREQLH